jgi:Uma2 family endonuclease
VDVVPELVVEVATPNDPAEELLERCLDALKAGAELVWVVYPRLRQVHAYNSSGQPRVFTESDTLDGGEVLPEFGIPMVGLFPPVDLPEN